MKISATLAIVMTAIAAAGSIEIASAQQATPKSKAPARPAPPAPTPADNATGGAAATTPPSPGWTARCGSLSRSAPLECAIEQSAVLSNTGQLVVLVNIRVAADTHTPSAVIQLPLGLNLPDGAHLQVDDGKAVDLQIQTCEARGCYARTPIAPDLLAAMKSGKQLKVSFQNLNKETIAVPLPLADFAAAYEKIK